MDIKFRNQFLMFDNTFEKVIKSVINPISELLSMIIEIRETLIETYLTEENNLGKGTLAISSEEDRNSLHRTVLGIIQESFSGKSDAVGIEARFVVTDSAQSNSEFPIYNIFQTEDPKMEIEPR